MRGRLILANYKILARDKQKSKRLNTKADIKFAKTFPILKKPYLETIPCL